MSNQVNTNNNNNDNTNRTIVIIILVLLLILLILAFIVGYSWYKDRKSASEPKRVTINKHINTVMPTQVAPTQFMEASVPVITTPVVTNVVAPVKQCPFAASNINSINNEKVYYDGTNFSLV